MSINLLNLIYFSPTGTTRKVLEGIASGIAPAMTEFTDLSAPGAELYLDKNQPDLAIIGMPTYAGRIPPEGAKLLKKLHSKGTPVVLAAIYGNNKFDDILLEMKDITSANGFIPVAAAAFIGEHSFSSIDKPIAAGRPDEQDMSDAKKFGESIRKKMLEYDANATNKTLKVPGNFPYREWNKIQAQPPAIDEDLCIKCGDCELACPVNAISINPKVTTDSSLCIFCCACVKQCPVSARKITDSRLLNAQERLFNSCSDRKHPETFL
jgi:ferredoxin/flavodoxin